MTLKQQREKVAEAIGIVLNAHMVNITDHAVDFYWVHVEMARMGNVLQIKVFDTGSMNIMPGENLVTAAAVALYMNPITEREPIEPTSQAMTIGICEDIQGLFSSLNDGDVPNHIQDRLRDMAIAADALTAQIETNKT